MNQQLQNSYSHVYYLGREQLWRTLQKFCSNQFQKFNDPFFKFWRSFGLFKDGQIPEAINELNQIKQKKEIQNAAYQALLMYHQNQKSLDRDAISEIKRVIQDSSPNDKQIQILCWFYLLNDEVRKASEVVQQGSSNNAGSINMNGWIELYKNTTNSIQYSMQLFNEGLENNPNHLDLLLGKCVASEKIKKFTITIDSINSIIVEYPDFQPAKEIKAKVLMMIGDWDQTIELAQTIIYQDPDNIPAGMILLFNQIGRIGGPEENLEQLKSFIQKLEQNEPQNNDLFLYVSKLFSRLAGRDQNIISLTQELLQKCKQNDPLNADFALELANQYLIIKDYESAFQYFQEAASLDESKMESLGGMINCKIFDGHLEDAQQQIQFMNDMCTDGKTSQIAYLEALIYISQNNTTEALKFLDDSLKIHIIKSKNLNPDLKFYIKLDPSFLFNLAECYLNLNDSKQLGLTKGIKLIETITAKIPGFIDAHILLSKGRLQQNNPSGALKSINRSLEIDPQNKDARIYQAMISLKEGNLQQAENSLDQAISQNFKIRENPVFLLLKGEVEMNQNNNKQARQTFENLLNMNGIKIGQPLPKQDGMFPFQDEQRCEVYLNLAKIYSKLNLAQQAKELIEEAIGEWAGTPQEVAVLMANSSIQLQNGDIKKAIDILKSVDKENPNFAQSRKQMADIYLKHLKDRRNYAKCYVDLIENNPTYDNYKLLGNALLSIQEPEDAIIYFKKALQINPSDEEITREIGYCLTQTHEFLKAIKYYETALMQNPKRIDLMLDLGKLYTQIGNFDKAEQYLQAQLFAEELQQPTVQILRRNIQGFIAIYELNIIRFEDGNEYCRKALERAIAMQGDLIEKCKQDGYSIDPERKMISELYLKLANYLVKFENNDAKALTYLERALKYNNNDEQIVQLMISIYFKTEDFDECLVKCKQLTKINPRNEYASLMISELMIINNQGQQALEQFEQLYNKSPSNMGLLSKLIILYIRNAEIPKAQAVLSKSESLSQNKNEPGICFCRGLLYKAMAQPSKALKEFNKAKRHTAYVDECVRHMLEIFINPNQDLYFSFSQEINCVQMIDPENIKGAENALLDCKDRSTDQIKFMSLFAKLLLFGKQDLQIITGVSSRKKLKSQEFIDQASQILKKILEDKPNSHVSLLYLAIAFYQSKKNMEAKQCLQKIVYSNYQSDYGEIYEMACLIFTDNLMYERQFDEAEKILKQAFMYNKSNGKIMEMLGVIKEKQQDFQVAVTCYQKAWEMTQQSSASIGLAQIYLKQRKIPRCIEVCEKVIKQYPNYPRIDKEIMQKAIQQIKSN